MLFFTEPWREASKLIAPEEDVVDDTADIAFCAQFAIPAPYLLLLFSDFHYNHEACDNFQ